MGFWTRSSAPRIGRRQYWYLNNMGVPESLRGTGIGSRLLRGQLEIVAHAEPAYVIALSTQKPENVTFYQRLGFSSVLDEVIGRGPHAFRTWIMVQRFVRGKSRGMKFYGHPFSSYCLKALITLYENDTPFEFRIVGPGAIDDKAAAEHARLWPLERIPVLEDEGRTVLEASIIIEYLDLHHPGRVRMRPADPRAAIDVRMMDRFFDNYVSTPMQRIVFDSIRDEANRDRQGVAEARKLLDAAYRWLDARMADREWAAGGAFTLADCAAAPALFYADWTLRIGTELRNVHAYRQRLLARPSYARAVDEARPYRQLFPLGAPDRD